MKFLKRLLWIFLGVCFLVFGIGLLLFWYFGGFTRIVFFEQQFDPVTIIYTGYSGEYRSVVYSIQKFHNDFTNSTQKKAISIYHINIPFKSGLNTGLTDYLYVELGTIFSGDNITGQNISFDTSNGQKHYKTKKLSGCNAVVVSFPYKHPLSYMFAPLVVYPYFNEYLLKNGYDINIPRIEIYDKEAQKIDFVACLVKKN